MRSLEREISIISKLKAGMEILDCSKLRITKFRYIFNIFYSSNLILNL